MSHLNIFTITESKDPAPTTEAWTRPTVALSTVPGAHGQGNAAAASTLLCCSKRPSSPSCPRPFSSLPLLSAWHGSYARGTGWPRRGSSSSSSRFVVSKPPIILRPANIVVHHRHPRPSQARRRPPLGICRSPPDRAEPRRRGPQLPGPLPAVPALVHGACVQRLPQRYRRALPPTHHGAGCRQDTHPVAVCGEAICARWSRDRYAGREACSHCGRGQVQD